MRELQRSSPSMHVLAVLIISLSILFSSFSDTAFAAQKKKCTGKKCSTKNFLTGNLVIPQTECEEVRFRYWNNKIKGSKLRADDEKKIEYCSTKHKKKWEDLPNAKECSAIRKYEARKQLTRMVQRKKLTWTDVIYCRSKQKK